MHKRKFFENETDFANKTENDIFNSSICNLISTKVFFLYFALFNAFYFYLFKYFNELSSQDS